MTKNYKISICLYTHFVVTYKSVLEIHTENSFGNFEDIITKKNIDFFSTCATKVQKIQVEDIEEKNELLSKCPFNGRTTTSKFCLISCLHRSFFFQLKFIFETCLL